MEAHAQRRRPIRRGIGAFIFIVAVMGRSTLYAQTPAPVQAPAPVLTAAVARDVTPPVEQSTDSVRLLVGRSTIVNVGKPIARVSLTSADIADALVTSPNELLINGKAAGTISMFVWDRAGAIRRYDVIVQRDLARLAAQLKELFPKESIDVRANGKTAVLSGNVSSKDVADKMASLAGSFVDSKEELVSLLQVGIAGQSNQVLLRVRFAEVSRSAMTELGVSLFTGAGGYKNYLARTTTDQTPAPTFDSNGAQPKLIFSDFLNLFLFNNKEQLGAVIKALQTKGLFQSLAEPNLIAESGKEASFLAGGEFPIPVAQGSSGGGVSISVVFKEFGIRLSFTPVVIGNRVHLKVKPEVSTLDFSNAVSLNGFRIPALSTRRTETEVELNDGQTFAIAGLMNQTMNTTMQKIPGIGDIPILGLLFKSKAAQKNSTELVVMITPEILPNNSPGVTPNLPKMPESFLPPQPQGKNVPVPAPAFRSAVDDQLAAPVADAAPVPAAPAPSATPATSTPGARKTAADKKRSAAAAAKLKSNSASTRPVVRAPEPEPATPAADTSPATSARERQAADRATKEDRQRQELEARAAADEEKRHQKQAEIDTRKQKIEDARLARINRAQSVRDAEAAKRAADEDKEQAKKQAEIDKRHQKEIADAQSRLRAAQAAYQAELSKLQSK
jgi:pilus assembly protein CpaC